MGERKRRSFEELTREEQAKVEASRARHRTPESKAEDEFVRAEVRKEFPPLVPDPQTLAVLAELRRVREGQGLSLADLSELTGFDRATLSKLETGKNFNPTLGTLYRIAQALGKRLDWSIGGLADLQTRLN